MGDTPTEERQPQPQSQGRDPLEGLRAHRDPFQPVPDVNHLEDESGRQVFSGVPLYDAEGNPVDLDPSEATQAFLDGRAFAGQGERVPVVLPNGDVGTVPSDQLQSTIQEHGGRVTSLSHLMDARHREEYGDQPLRQLGEAAVGGALFLDPALMSEGAALRQRHGSQAVSGVGEVAGAVLPGLLTGGTSLMASGGSAAARVGFIAAMGAYFVTGQIFPGVF